MRRTLIAANWKMYKTIDESLIFLNGLKECYPASHPVEVVVCAPFTSLFSLAEKAIGSRIKIGAQNCHFAKQGAFTGEISTRMLTDAGCDMVILGHSERRQYFNESDELINKKILAALAERLTVIFCVGETLEQRKANETLSVVQTQILGGLNGIDQNMLDSIIIAYEPVWAIGTGMTATPEQAGEVHAMIRTLIASTYNEQAAQKMRILYGGSVKPDNVDTLMAIADIDGALVGGASLELQSFLRLINYQPV